MNLVQAARNVIRPRLQSEGEIGDAVPLGIGLVITGFGIAALSGAILKWIGSELPALQIAWGRYVFYLLCLLPFGLIRYRSAVFAPRQPVIQIARAGLILGATLLFILAVRDMPLAVSIAIVYVYPFLMTALSGVFLGEKVPGFAWFGVCSGFLGVLVVMRPDPWSLNVSALYALGAGVFFAAHLLLTRKVAKESPPLVASVYMALAALAMLTPFMPLYWQSMELWHVGALALAGTANALAHCVIMMAFQRAPASSLAPFTYVEIVFMIGYGMLFFAELPDTVSLAGIGLIVVSGLLVSLAPRLSRAMVRRRSVSG